jgi:hypothetical protein
MTSAERQTFENDLNDGTWPEVGSRMMVRMIEGQDFCNGWIVVEPDWYRYAVFRAAVLRHEWFSQNIWLLKSVGTIRLTWVVHAGIALSEAALLPR